MQQEITQRNNANNRTRENEKKYAIQNRVYRLVYCISHRTADETCSSFLLLLFLPTFVSFYFYYYFHMNGLEVVTVAVLRV